MYWFRSASILNFVPWLLTAMLWSLGGWLIATHAFEIEKKERLVIGFGLGMVLYLWLVNLVGRFMTPVAAFFIPALVVLFIGLAMAWKSGRPFLNFADFSIYPFLIILAALFVYSVMLERGLSIFDDYHHLPAISVIGAGSLPPRDYLYANFNYFYHYGFELLGGSLMRLGDLFAWSASDVSKALVWAYSMILFGFVFYRYLRRTWKAITATILLAFLGGTRYLLMLLPVNILHFFDSSIGFEGISGDLGQPFSKALFSAWNVGGGPPQPIPFGIVNGINSPYIFSHGGEWPLALIILLLLWLLSTSINTWKSIPILTILMAHLALTFESSYGLMLLAMVLVAIYLWRKKPKFNIKPFWYLSIASAISFPFAMLQGGTLFSIALNLFSRISGASSTVTAAIMQNTNTSAFTLHWPPTIFSAHFGALNIFNPGQLIVGLFEIGPILFFSAWITSWAISKFRDGDWLVSVLIVSAWLGFIISLFVTYNLAERDITRFTKHALILWMIIFIIQLFSRTEGTAKWGWWVMFACAVVMSIGGVVIFIDQLSAIRKPVLSEGIEGVDSHISSQVWGNLPQTGWIFDPGSNNFRATALTGIPTVAGQDYFTTPEWKELSKNPSLQGFLVNHFRYLYVDNNWWNSLTSTQQVSLSAPCIKTIAEYDDNETYQNRRILDFGGCE